VLGFEQNVTMEKTFQLNSFLEAATTAFHNTEQICVEMVQATHSHTLQKRVQLQKLKPL